VQTCCVSFWTMVLGRIISGFGVGMLSMVVPIYQVREHLLIIGGDCTDYQSEISPASHVSSLGSGHWTDNSEGFTWLGGIYRQHHWLRIICRMSTPLHCIIRLD
jgi:hypothetical protein